jgi:50S ribosomal subunit-associated GTPase HflX
MAFTLTITEDFRAQSYQSDYSEENGQIRSCSYGEIDNFCMSVTKCIREVRELIENIRKKQADYPGSITVWDEMDKKEWPDFRKKISDLKAKTVYISKLNWESFGQLRTTLSSEQELKIKHDELIVEKDLFKKCNSILQSAIDDMELNNYPNLDEIDKIIKELNVDIKNHRDYMFK